MTKIIIKANEICAEDFTGIEKELFDKYYEQVRRISELSGMAIADTYEAIAQHIQTTDEDYIFEA